MLKYAFILIALLNFTGDSNAQKRQVSKTIYLKDGTVLKGEIVEDNNYFIRILINTGDTIQVGYKNIIDDPGAIKKRDKKKERFYRGDPLFWNLNMRGQIKDERIVELIARMGWRIRDRFNIALGLGVLERRAIEGLNMISPTYLHLGPYVRYYLNSGKPKYFVSGSMDYSFSISDNNPQFVSEDHHGGIIGDLGIGVHFAGLDKLRWLIDVGITYEKFSGKLTHFGQWNEEVTSSYSNRYLSPRLGLTLEF